MVGVSWLPTFHDMGLIGMHISAMLGGGAMVYFSPLDFLDNPLVWLKVISEWKSKYDYRSVGTAAPPFALELCVKNVSPTQL